MKSIAVRDACKAVSNAKIFNIGLKQAQTAGIRLDETFAEPGFRSRKNTKQNCFIPAKAVFPEGPYPKLLDTLKMAETTPEIHRDSRLTVVKKVDFGNKTTISLSCDAPRKGEAPPPQQCKAAPPGNLTREHRADHPLKPPPGSKPG